MAGESWLVEVSRFEEVEEIDRGAQDVTWERGAAAKVSPGILDISEHTALLAERAS